MTDFPTKKITIYHKNKENYERYEVEASIREISILNHNKNGSNSTENVIIRIFDTKGYNSKWKVAKGDVIVNMVVEDKIESAPYSELKKKYGVENVYTVKKINKMNFDDPELEELTHIKLGCE